ncbi:CRISPR-associated protein Cas5 [Thermovibrio sp.]
MEVIKVKLYQPFACYSLPFSFGAVNTYFLPPPSTLKGFVHSTAGANKDYPMFVSVHGKIGGTTYELQRMVKFDRTRAGQPKLEGFGRSLLKSPTFVEVLTDVFLTLYLYFPAESSPLKEAFLKNLLEVDFPSLGRKEDFALLVKEPETVELEPFEELEEELLLKEFTYFKRETGKELGLTGALYRLPLSYDGELAERVGWRFFKREELLLAPPGQVVEPEVEGLFYDPQEEKLVELIELPAGYRHVLG